MDDTTSEWFISSHCGANNSCVQARKGTDAIQIRDTKLKDESPILTFSAEAWAEFLTVALSPQNERLFA
jgi:hypothetical protein